MSYEKDLLNSYVTSASLSTAVATDTLTVRGAANVSATASIGTLLVSGLLGVGTTGPTSTVDVYGTISNRGGSATDDGYVNLVNGDGTFTGYIEFRKADTTRLGYLGYASSSGTFKLIGETAIGLAFGVQGSETARIDTNGYLLVGYTSSNGAYRLQVNSQIFATSSTIATSDGRYKTDVTPLDGALHLVGKLNPVQFSWKPHPVHEFDTSTPTIGFIAQEVQDALHGTPYLGAIVKANACEVDGVSEEFLGIVEGNLIALLTKAIQELKAEVDSLKARIS